MAEDLKDLPTYKVCRAGLVARLTLQRLFETAAHPHLFSRRRRDLPGEAKNYKQHQTTNKRLTFETLHPLLFQTKLQTVIRDQMLKPQQCKSLIREPTRNRGVIDCGGPFLVTFLGKQKSTKPTAGDKKFNQIKTILLTLNWRKCSALAGHL